MNNTILRATAALTLIPAALVALAASAQAREGHINGYTVSIVESGSYAAPDFITVYGPAGPEQITVTCAPYSWSSYGHNTQAFVDSIARSWCF